MNSRVFLLLIVIAGIVGQTWGQTENIHPKLLYLLRTCPPDKRDVRGDSTLLCFGDTTCNSKKVLSIYTYEIPTLSHKKDKMAYIELSRKLIISDINGENKVLIYDWNPTASMIRTKWPTAAIFSPVWSFDDSKLLFIKNSVNGESQNKKFNKHVFCIVDLKTNKIDSIDISYGIREIYWAKDKALVVYRKNQYRKGFENNPKGLYWKLFSFNLNTGEEKELTDETMSVSYNEMSPEGDKIIFNSERQLYTINVDGTNKRQVTHITYKDSTNDGSSTHMPTWSSDGKKIAFILGKKREANLAIMNADGSDLKLIDKKLIDYQPSQLMWSKNDKWLITRLHRSCESNIIDMISADGTIVKHLQNVSCVNSSFIWVE
jgi:Tol biopolymer transport system component